MTPEQAARVLKLEESHSGDGDELRKPLTADEEDFCQRMAYGPTQDNATKSYEAIHPEVCYGTAGSIGPALAKEVRIRRRIAQLREAAAAKWLEGVGKELEPWSDLAVLAQRRLRNHLLGIEHLTGNTIAVCNLVLDRAFGKPAQPIDLQVATREKVSGATKVFMSRVSEERRRLAAGKQVKEKEAQSEAVSVGR